MKNFNNNLKKYEFNMKPIKLFDSFAGIGALHQALNELGVPVELVGISEIDIDAIISYGAVHNVTSNKIKFLLGFTVILKPCKSLCFMYFAN